VVTPKKPNAVTHHNNKYGNSQKKSDAVICQKKTQDGDGQTNRMRERPKQNGKRPVVVTSNNRTAGFRPPQEKVKVDFVD
jgi:hypothetical protein